MKRITPEHYLAVAHEWEKRAKEAPSHISAEFLTLAAQWRKFAAEAQAISTAKRTKRPVQRQVIK